MSTRYSSKTYTLERTDKRTGFKTWIVFTGNLKNKPTGWRVLKAGTK